MRQPMRDSVRNKEKISLVRRTSNFENLLVRQSQHLSKQFPRNEAHGLGLGLGTKTQIIYSNNLAAGQSVTADCHHPCKLLTGA